MRRHPTVSDLTREASMDYKVPGTDVIIKKGERVLLPIKPFQMDERLFPNPGEFNIERNYRNLMNFGLGPRVCIA